MIRTNPRKWIDQEIARLDPEQDYSRIWKLGHSYRVNDFLMSYLYTNSLPVLFTAFKSSRAVLREGKGKIYKKPLRRMDDSNHYILVWWDNGPHSDVSRQAAERVNQMHTYWESKYPGDFQLEEDFIFVLCYFAAGLHIVRKKVGLSGYDDKMKFAAWKFWSEIASLFRLGGDGKPLSSFPTSFDGILAFIQKIESRGWGHNEHDKSVIDQVVRPFVTRYFPRPFHGIGRALVFGLISDDRLEALGVPPAKRWQKWFARNIVRLGILANEKLLPDPELTLLERHQRRTQSGGSATGAYQAAASS